MIRPFLISERSIPSSFMHQSSLTMLAHSEVMTVSKCTTRHKLSAVAMKPVIMQEKFSVSQGKGMPQRIYIHTPVQTPGTDRCMHNYPPPTTHYRNMTTSGIHWTSTNGMVPFKTFSLNPPGVQPQTQSPNSLWIQGAPRLWHTRFEKSFATFTILECLRSYVWRSLKSKTRKRKASAVNNKWKLCGWHHLQLPKCCQ